jgi:hypothetical protein
MENKDFLNAVIDKYGKKDVYGVYELCIEFYKSETGYELGSETKSKLQDGIYSGIPLQKILDNVIDLIEMFKKSPLAKSKDDDSQGNS